ncbi:EF-hand domain-containing protein [Agrilutibacter solisilvae]|uniref:EF-hand domain-containing protein n=1 Tax=Agrilutibacter solisilvae TaxID=2763317 RepID=A0A975ATZ5_9GAMM|nr:EF-hand domain-containing protein [Lysobacter solisilvae]QSX79540.1 EF-hand domain-containing protein [Lysobacter solisilvae]
MNQLSRKSLLGSFALVAMLSAPLAFAQETSTTTDPAQPPAADAQAQPTTTSNDASAATTAGDPAAKKSWADVDADKDGKLSKAEADSVPALATVFGQADADADGTLTADEYKAYVAKNQEGAEKKDAKQ